MTIILSNLNRFTIFFSVEWILNTSTHLAYVATLPCETLLSAKQAINDKLQGSVATYLRYGGVVNKQIKKVYCCVWVHFFNRWIFGKVTSKSVVVSCTLRVWPTHCLKTCYISRQYTPKWWSISVVTELDVEQLRWRHQRRYRRASRHPVASDGALDKFGETSRHIASLRPGLTLIIYWAGRGGQCRR